jgi:hypothetical protein
MAEACSATSGNPLQKRVMVFLCVAAALVAAATAYRMVHAIPQDRALNHVSGVWTAQARDLAEGVFYRPLASDDGYGGGRYMPLHFVLQALIIKAGMEPVRAGYPIVLFSLLATIVGTYFLLRGLGVRPLVAIPASLFAFATFSGQRHVAMIRGDLLPLALTVWGIVCALRLWRDEDSRAASWGAAIFFALTFMAKLTSLYGPLAIVVALLLAGRRSRAIRLAIQASALAIALFALAAFLSDGRLINYLIKCGSGGATFGSILKSPITLFHIIAFYDPASFIILCMAGGILLTAPRKTLCAFPSVLLLACVVVTFLIFLTPGINYNHLVDLHLVIVVFLVAWAARHPRATARVLCMLALATSICAIYSVRRYRWEDAGPRRAEVKQVLALVPEGEGPLLAEDSLVPLYADERPFMMDPFAFNALAVKVPSMRDRFHKQLDSRYFRAVILYTDARSPAGQQFLKVVHFGPGFVEHLNANYRFLDRKHDMSVYVRKKPDAP